jgi:hypothetical protein
MSDANAEEKDIAQVKAYALVLGENIRYMMSRHVRLDVRQLNALRSALVVLDELRK